MSFILIIIIVLLIGLLVGCFAGIAYYISERITSGLESQSGSSDSGQDQELTPEQARDLEYPYYKLYTDEQEIRRLFQGIRDIEPDLRDYKFYVPLLEPRPDVVSKLNSKQRPEYLYKGRSQVIVWDSRLSDISLFTDWFNEQCRIKCVRANEKINQLNYWNQNKDKLIKECLRRNGKITVHALSDTVYDHIRGCVTFNAGLIVKFIKLFGATSVLDISAGWGDRLIGALAMDVEYLSVDPNKCLSPGYRAMIDMFSDARDKHERFKVINSGFETADLPDRKFDLVLSSPPYFNLEVYSEDPGQSIHKFDKLEKWYSGFLIPSVEKAWNHITPGGHMVLYINNIPGHPDYVLRMRDHISGLPDANYLGIIGLIMSAPKSEASRANTPGVNASEANVPGVSARAGKPFLIWEKSK